jgi:hypothetical protein
MSQVKELDFFATESNWKLGEQWYERQFDAAGDALAIGEASTSYAKYPMHGGVPERISKMLPEVRLVYLVRHPIERLRSQYLHQSLHGIERRPIERAVLEDPNYVDFSRYALQIERFLEYFPLEQMLVIKSEDLRQNRRPTVDRALKFIGVDGSPPEGVLEEEFHRTAEKRVLRPFFGWTHRLPGYDGVTRLVPQSVKERTFQFRTRGIDPSPAILSASVQGALEDQLREDIRRLRSYMPEDFDGWLIG